MTAVDRLVWWPWIRLWRFAAQFASRKGRRRLRRRAGWRLVALLAFGPWVLPFLVAWAGDELNHFVRGRVQVRGSAAPEGAGAVLPGGAPCSYGAGVRFEGVHWLGPVVAFRAVVEGAWSWDVRSFRRRSACGVSVATAWISA